MALPERGAEDLLSAVEAMAAHWEGMLAGDLRPRAAARARKHATRCRELASKMKVAAEHGRTRADRARLNRGPDLNAIVVELSSADPANTDATEWSTHPE